MFVFGKSLFRSTRVALGLVMMAALAGCYAYPAGYPVYGGGYPAYGYGGGYPYYGGYGGGVFVGDYGGYRHRYGDGGRPGNFTHGFNGRPGPGFSHPEGRPGGFGGGFHGGGGFPTHH
jgi:hypothetical protein